MSWGWNYRPYVSAAEKRRRAEAALKKVAKGGQRLEPIAIDGRTIARSFWGKSWCGNLESYSDYSNRLPRGRSYVRNGSVLDLQISAGTVSALVSGSDLYKIKISISPVKAAAWKALKQECSGRVGSLIDLLQGKLSAPVMEIITRRESGLFPKPAEIQLACSCPDYADMCKHVAAVLYGIGARLDRTPELLFVLRGADHLELITEAAESISASVATPAADTLALDVLSDVFGIEIDSGGAAVKPKPGKRRARPSIRKTAAAAKVPRVRAPKKPKTTVKAATPRKPAARKKIKPATTKKSGGRRSTKSEPRRTRTRH
jgi:uncharacterized Zn finger protein